MPEEREKSSETYLSFICKCEIWWGTPCTNNTNKKQMLSNGSAWSHIENINTRNSKSLYWVKVQFTQKLNLSSFTHPRHPKSLTFIVFKTQLRDLFLHLKAMQPKYWYIKNKRSVMLAWCMNQWVLRMSFQWWMVYMWINKSKLNISNYVKWLGEDLD